MSHQRAESSDQRAGLTRLHAALTWLLETSAALLPAQSLEDTLDYYLGRLLDWLGAEQGSVMLRQADDLIMVACRGLGPDVTRGMTVRAVDGPAGEVASNGVPRLLSERLPSRRTCRRPASAMIIPLRARGGVVGVLNIGKVSRARPFTPEELQTTSILALQLAWILSNFELTARGAYGWSETDRMGPGLIKRMARIIAANGTLTPEEGTEFGSALTDLADRIEEAVEILRQLTGVVNPQTAPGDLRLTPRELEVLGSLAEGRSNAEIARQCWISENTVKFHLKNLFAKLGIRDRGQAIMVARAMYGRLPSTPAASSPAHRGLGAPVRRSVMSSPAAGQSAKALGT